MLDLAALQRAPDTFPPDTVYPPPLDIGATPEEWAARRDTVRRRWLDFLGPFPERCDLAPTVTEETEESTHVRRKVSYCVEAACGGLRVEAYLLIPHDLAAPAPGVVLFHPTSHYSLREPVGLAGPPSLHNALHLVERGCVVLCPRNFLWGYRGMAYSGGDDWKAQLTTIVDGFRADHPGWCGMGKMTWDGIRAIDILCAIDEVDADRVGCFGFSLGGKEALYLPAFDDRVRASVSMDGGIGMTYSNWEDPWYLGARVRADGFAMDHHELLSLVAPRAFLLIGSVGGVSEDSGTYVDGADGERSWPYIDAALPLYRMLGAEHRLGMVAHAHGHSVPRVARETACAWLDYFLRDKA